MAVYFASDVHLRPDRPDRAGRFARLVDALETDDELVVVGDLCDFWFASRGPLDPSSCDGLRALVAFRKRGGILTILPGNHDAWLGPFYANALGARMEPAGGIDRVIDGLRIHAVHGHRLGAQSRWKGAMESRAFLRAFGVLPRPVARGLETCLERSKDETREADDRRHLDRFRRYADGLTTDLVMMGHVHIPLDDASRSPRLIVLGGWLDGSSYVRVDAEGASLVVGPVAIEPMPNPGGAASPSSSRASRPGSG